MPSPPLTRVWESRCFRPQPHPAMWLRRGPGCRRPSDPWAVGPNSPLGPAPTCRVGQAISSPLVFPPALGWEGLGVQWGTRGGLRCKVCGVPTVQWRSWTGVAGPGNPGGAANVARSLNGWGLALGEITCGGWGPHLQYSFLINFFFFFFFFLFMDVEKKIELKSPKLHTQGPPGTARAALGSMPVPPTTAKNRGILILRPTSHPTLELRRGPRWSSP